MGPEVTLAFSSYLFIWGVFDIQILYLTHSKEASTFNNDKVCTCIPRRNFTYAVAAQCPFYMFIMEWLHWQALQNRTESGEAIYSERMVTMFTEGVLEKQRKK